MKRVVKKTLIAHKHNNYKPHLLREVGALVTIAFVAAVFVSSNTLGKWIARTDLGAAIYPAVLTDLTNSDRTAYGLSGLKVNPLLEKAALMKAEDMAARGYFAHNSPDGKAPWYWIEQAGYAYVYAGENLAIDFNESRDIENAWMNSPGHRANILNPRYTEVGIAMKEGVFEGKPTVFVVQMFASPKVKPTPVVAVAEASPEPKSEPVKKTTLEPIKVAAVPAAQTPTVKSAEIALEQRDIAPQATPIEKAVASPGNITLIIYAIVCLAALISLLSFVFIEIRHRDMKHVFYGIVILAITGIFAYLEWVTVFSNIKIA